MAERHAGILIAIPRAEKKDLEFVKELGEGGFGIVYQSIWSNRGEVAVKKIFEADPNFENEVNYLHRAQHPNIIKLLGIAACPRNDYIIMEFAEGGSLDSLLHHNLTTEYTMAKALDWARQIAVGLAHLHGMQPHPLIHCDLKPANLVLKNGNRDLKICDFGTVVERSPNMKEVKGTARYMAPEVFAEENNYNEQCDVYSWAMTVWAILSRQRPFDEYFYALQIMHNVNKGKRPPIANNWPAAIVELLEECWATDPASRPVMENVVHNVEMILENLVL